MSPTSNEHIQVNTSENIDTLAVIREEQCSPAFSSSVNIDTPSKAPSEGKQSCQDCSCLPVVEAAKGIEPADVEKLLLDKEIQLREEFQLRLESEINGLKERFDYILQNEQIRASYMLREAHRERQEKITALQAQLQCKNLAGLMFVMCAERQKSKLDKLRVIEEYTGYVKALQQILAEGQFLLLHLSRGYKTAARVDHEWREKMTKVIREFQAYVLHYGGGTPETNQYFIDLPALLKTEASIYDNPKEDPCETEDDECEQLIEEESESDKPWYEVLDGDCRPFVMLGDMAEFKPPQRRQVLGALKAAKTVPKYWKEYVFNEMFLHSKCSNADDIKDEYPTRLPPISKWECIGVQTDRPSKTSLVNFRGKAASIDPRGNMGSILKIITSSVMAPSAKAILLGARDSMEIVSTTKLRERHRKSENSKVVINVGRRKESLFNEVENVSEEELLEGTTKTHNDENRYSEDTVREEEEEGEASLNGSEHNIDSVKVLNPHEKAHDRASKVNYEKRKVQTRWNEHQRLLEEMSPNGGPLCPQSASGPPRRPILCGPREHSNVHSRVCPVEQCEHMQVDSFVRCLPPYMRASPFTHFQQTFEDYETCSPEQLVILRQRIEDKKKQDKAKGLEKEESPLHEWTPEVEGVGVQTSNDSLPPCTCIVPSPTPVSSTGKIFNMDDLIPVKQTMDAIRQHCFYDSDIEFDRFRVLGEDMSNNVVKGETLEVDFTKKRLSEIKKILKKHPSVCEIFQANTQCQ